MRKGFAPGPGGWGGGLDDSRNRATAIAHYSRPPSLPPTGHWPAERSGRMLCRELPFKLANVTKLGSRDVHTIRVT